jgi:hypothetical protein
MISSKWERGVKKYLYPDDKNKREIALRIAPYLDDEEHRDFFIIQGVRYLEDICNNWELVYLEFIVLFDPFQPTNMGSIFLCEIPDVKRALINKINQLGLPKTRSEIHYLDYCLSWLRIKLFVDKTEIFDEIEYRGFWKWKRPVKVRKPHIVKNMKTKEELIKELS